MKRKYSPLLTLLGAVLVAGGVFLFLKPVSVLEVQNLDHPPCVRLRMKAPTHFEMLYIHSIYNSPVVEEFLVEGQWIVLKGVRTGHPGVMEYYGFERVEGFHRVKRDLGSSFEIRRGIREGQGLTLAGKTIPLKEWGEKGDRIRICLRTIPWALYALSKISPPTLGRETEARNGS